jgi:hypothetical protein
MMRNLLLLAVVLLCLPVLATAQTASVTNPSAVVFEPSPDHAVVDAYELDILRADGSVLQTINLGKPVVNTTTNECTVPLNVQPVTFGKGYTVRVRVVVLANGPVYSDYVVSSNAFERAPGKPAKLSVK